jgi:hypothetical protein
MFDDLTDRIAAVLDRMPEGACEWGYANPFVHEPDRSRLEGLPERIRKLIWIDPFSDCWLFAGKWQTGNGYGKTYWKGAHRVFHKVVWWILRGPVCPGFKLDHLCRVRLCCNPDHLDPVPDVVNVRRGAARLFKTREHYRLLAVRAARSESVALPAHPASETEAHSGDKNRQAADDD